MLSATFGPRTLPLLVGKTLNVVAGNPQVRWELPGRGIHRQGEGWGRRNLGAAILTE